MLACWASCSIPYIVPFEDGNVGAIPCGRPVTLRAWQPNHARRVIYFVSTNALRLPLPADKASTPVPMRAEADPKVLRDTAEYNSIGRIPRVPMYLNS